MRKILALVFILGLILSYVWTQSSPNLDSAISSSTPSSSENHDKTISIDVKQSHNTNSIAANSSNFLDVEQNKSDESENIENNTNNGIPLPPEEIALKYAELIKNRQNLKSKSFTSGAQWNEIHEVDEYSEWGNMAAETFRTEIINSLNEKKRPLNLEQVDCRTTFCKISFSFPAGTPKNRRNVIYPELLYSSNRNLSYASYYDEESGNQHIYAELCTECD